MGMELEFKLAVPSPVMLENILFDSDIAAVRRGNYSLLNMATVYYDTPDHRFSQRRWTLRLRQENEAMIVTLKTPAEGRARGEWAVPAYSVQTALPQLVEQGAPAELMELVEGQAILPVCAAEFTRRAVDVAFADGTVCELCGDIGVLVGGGKEEPLCEIEIELKEGDAETAEAFAGELMDRFNLQEEPRSKFARASALAKENCR